MSYQNIVGALCFGDYKGANRQYVEQDKLIVETAGGVVAMDRATFNQGANAQFDFETKEGETMPTVVAKGLGAVAYAKPIGMDMQSSNGIGSYLEDKMTTLIIGDNPGWQNGVCHKATGVDCFNASTTGDKAMTISSAATDSNHIPCVIEDDVQYIVRRITPLECERLQGFPDGWTDIGEFIDTEGKKRKTSDAARYKALGNSIALPFWHWLIKRISGQYEYQPTMASLFDGIGGFPLVWQSVNGEGTCIWASEIEEFPIAVTKYHFGEGEER